MMPAPLKLRPALGKQSRLVPPVPSMGNVALSASTSQARPSLAPPTHVPSRTPSRGVTSNESHTPSPAPVLVSQSLSRTHGSSTVPAAHLPPQNGHGSKTLS